MLFHHDDERQRIAEDHFLRHASRVVVAPKIRYRSAPNDRTVTDEEAS